MRVMREQKALKGRRKYDEEFKRSAVRMIQSGQSVRSVSESLGVAQSLLHKWNRQFRDERSVDELEVVELKARLRQVEIERDILKKALSIFSRQS